MKVRVSKTAAAYFRKLARDAHPKEVQAFLIGRVVSPNLTIVDEWRYPKKYKTQTPVEVEWDQGEYAALIDEMLVQGTRLVGDCHSHCEWDAVMSPCDYKGHVAEGFRVAGICSVIGRRTRLRFWIAESALPVEIEYV